MPISLPPVPAAVLTNTAIRAAMSEYLKMLDERSKRVITRRFGLDGQKSETLHSIGQEEGVTRERIRQVEQTVLKLFRSEKRNAADFVNTKKVQEALTQIINYLGGTVREEMLCDLLKLKNEADCAALGFLLKCLPDLTETRESGRYRRYFRNTDHIDLDKITSVAREILTAQKRLLSDVDFFGKIREQAVSNTPNHVIFSALSITHDLVRTPFGQWGLKGWAEATPRGVGDKAYAILKRGGKPLHFSQITELINAAKFDERLAHPQTVHNELIRDGRFILVGRGTYALKEWGYQAGTVGDVLERIVRNNPQGLQKEALVEAVLKERIVKRNTIVLALQNRKRFTRDQKGFFGLAANSETQKQINTNNDEAVDSSPEAGSPSASHTEDPTGGVN